MSAESAETHLGNARMLLELLEQENQALQGGRPETLQAICRDKRVVLRRLDALLAVLNAAAGAVLDQMQRRTLRDLVQRCAERTHANEILLNARMVQTRKALQAWRGPAGNYDVNGQGRYESQWTVRSVA